jgi:DNA-binding NarL/FixJ family response regulator
MKQALVVDDHPIVRQALKDLLQTNFPFLKVKTSASNEGIVDEICGTPWAFVVLDLNLRHGKGLDILNQTKRCCPKLPIIIFSVHSQGYAGRALRAGATAYLSKESPPADLLALARQILGGSQITKASTQPKLSQRELQVLTLLAEGLRRNEIANRLDISEKTVSTHQANVILKLGLRNVLELVRYAIEEGFAKDT